MRDFSVTELQQSLGQVCHQAMRNPIALTRHGKRRLVLMSFEDYEILQAIKAQHAISNEGWTATTIDDAPENVTNELLQACEEIIKENG